MNSQTNVCLTILHVHGYILTTITLYEYQHDKMSVFGAKFDILEYCIVGDISS